MADLTFPMPDGFTPPENLDSDNTFQAMGTFQLVDDDTLKLVDIEGYQIGDEDTEGDTEAAKKADQANAASALQGAGSAAGAEANQGGPPGAPPTPPGRNLGTQAAQPSFGSQMAARFRAATGRR
jgi:hypothetical protein